MHAAIKSLAPYIEEQLARGVRLHAITRHLMGAFQSVRGARAFRRHLSEHGVRDGAGVQVLLDALALVDEESAAFAA